MGATCLGMNLRGSRNGSPPSTDGAPSKRSSGGVILTGISMEPQNVDFRSPSFNAKELLSDGTPVSLFNIRNCETGN